MSNASDFIIKNGVLTKYVGSGGEVVIPEGVTEIGIKAFISAGYQISSTVTSIQLPHSVAAIRQVPSAAAPASEALPCIRE